MVLASLPGLKVNFKDKNKKENTKMDCFMGRPYSTTQKQDGLKGNTGKEKDMGKEFTIGEMEAVFLEWKPHGKIIVSVVGGWREKNYKGVLMKKEIIR